MTETELSRNSVRAQVQQAHQALHASVQGLSEEAAQTIYATPEWSINDVLRHALVWDELSIRCLDDWQGSRDWAPTFEGEDAGEIFNIQSVAVSAHLDLATLIARLDAVYEYVKAILNTSSDEQLQEQGAAPWGSQISRLHLIEEMAAHDLEHADQIAATGE